MTARSRRENLVTRSDRQAEVEDRRVDSRRVARTAGRAAPSAAAMSTTNPADSSPRRRKSAIPGSSSITSTTTTTSPPLRLRLSSGVRPKRHRRRSAARCTPYRPQHSPRLPRRPGRRARARGRPPAHPRRPPPRLRRGAGSQSLWQCWSGVVVVQGGRPAGSRYGRSFST